jgi:hypothetical protein
MEPLMGKVAAIADPLPGQPRRQLRDRFSVIDVAGGDAQGQEFAPVIHHERELETVEPAHGGFAPARDCFEDLVVVDPAVVANHQGGRIDEGASSILTPAGVQIDAHRHQRGGDQRDEPRLAQQRGKLPPTVPAQMEQVKRLEVAVLGLMEVDQNRHDLAEG